MGILSRFRDIMASNINALLNKSDDPLKAVDEYMRSLNLDLGKVRAETASVTTEERRTKRALDECRDEADKLHRYAVKSVENGSESDARKFLERKAALSGKLSQLQSAYDTAALNAANMQKMQDKLLSDIGQLEARQSELKARWSAAQAQQKLNAKGTAPGVDRSAFDASEEKINRAYDEAEALAELRADAKDDIDAEFAQYERAKLPEPEDELAAIKRQLEQNKQ